MTWQDFGLLHSLQWRYVDWWSLGAVMYEMLVGGLLVWFCRLVCVLVCVCWGEVSAAPASEQEGQTRDGLCRGFEHGCVTARHAV